MDKKKRKVPGILRFSNLPLVLFIVVLLNTIATYRVFLSHGELDEEDLVVLHTKPKLDYHQLNILDIPPEGEPPNLPSIDNLEDDVHANDVKRLRKAYQYGGEGDAKHLGGFTQVDPEGISPHLWKFMIEYFGIKSIVDVGCGRGLSTTWFYLQGLDVQCVEGSKDGLKQNVLTKVVANSTNDTHQKNYVVEHDYTRGPWWPAKTVDAIWCVEFLEHVSRQHERNYIATFKKAAFLFVTHTKWGGWHHTEVHESDWWINRFEMYGFKYSESLTQKIRQVVFDEKSSQIPFPILWDGEEIVYDGQHMKHFMMVFINPLVASLPEHKHLLSEPGCFETKTKKVQCGNETSRNSRIISTPLPDDYKPLPYKEEKHKEWEKILIGNVDRGK